MNFLPVIIFFLLSTSALAVPSVSGVSGTVANGSSVTITGSSFGSGPGVIFFDSFEKGSTGSTISTSANSADIGDWDIIGNPVISTPLQ